MSKHNPPTTVIATLARPISGADAKRVQLLPDGPFAAVDGRPAILEGVQCKQWLINRAIAAKLIAQAAGRTNRTVIDWEHQTQRSATNGLPAPAAGWYSNLTWEDGVGLFAEVEWTPKARAAIEAKEYQYISPVFSFNPKTGEILQLLMAALTNTPGIDGMSPVMLHSFFQPHPQPDEDQLNPLLKVLLAALGLAEGTSDAQALTALNAHLADHQALKTKNTELVTQVATLSQATGQPDPTKFVPIAALTALQQQVAALQTATTASKVATLIASAQAQGKLPAALVAWATDAGNKDVAVLEAFLAAQPVNQALAGQQSNGTPPAATQTAQLSAEERAVAVMMGQDPAKLLALGGVK